MNVYNQKENHSSFFWLFGTCSFHHIILDMWLCEYESTWLSILLQTSHNQGVELVICAASFLLEILCIIRIWFSRFAMWKAFCWFFQVVNLERRRSGHRLWVKFHREESRPRTGVIFGACKCCNQGLGAPCKSYREFSKNCKNQSHPPEKMGVASTKILSLHPPFSVPDLWSPRNLAYPLWNEPV